MQNNGLVKLFAFLFGIVSIYQLSFTFIASNQEAKAKSYAQQLIGEDKLILSPCEKAEVQYLDSIGGRSLYGFTRFLQRRQRKRVEQRFGPQRRYQRYSVLYEIS